MAISLTHMRDALDDAVRPDDGLTKFAVWTVNDIANNRIVVTKVEKYDPRKHYRSDMSGVVRAKDELDVYRFVESYNE